MLHYLFKDCEFTIMKCGQVTEILSVNGLDTLEGVQGLERSNKGRTLSQTRLECLTALRLTSSRNATE